MTDWCKIDSGLDANPKIRRAGREGREVFLFVLRRVRACDNAGWIPIANIDPAYLADMLMMSESDASRGVTACRDAGLLYVEAEKCLVCGWTDAWGKRPATDAERQQKRRDSKKKTDDVTERHEASVTVRDSHVGEERRGEEKRVSKRASKPAVTVMPADWQPKDSHRTKATELRVNLADQAERFKNHHGAKGSVFADWDLAFHTWLRNSVDFGRGGSGAPAPPSPLFEARRKVLT